MFLLPPDLAEWLPEGHLAWFVIEVIDSLDTSAFHARTRKRGAWSGRASYDPDMLLALLVYAYASGVRSSRRIEALCEVDVAFRVICANDGPDHTTLARFRRAHLKAFEELFAQVLRLCARAGMARVGVVAVDGTKIAANASAGANRGEDWLREQAQRVVGDAEQVDAAEDVLFGEARGDELPADLADPRSRAGRIRQCLDLIEAENAEREQRAAAQREAGEEYVRQTRSGQPARLGRPPAGADPVAVAQARLARERERAAARARERQAKAERAAARGHRLPGTPPAPVEQAPLVRRAEQSLQRAQEKTAAAQPQPRREQQSSQPKESQPKDRYNVTDPDSRIMPTRLGWVQGYNAQLAVSEDHIILATGLVQQPGDVEQFQPMMSAAAQAAERLAGYRPHPPADCDGHPASPGRVGLLLADAGYLSQDNLTAVGPDRLIAVSTRHEQEQQARTAPATGPPPAEASPIERMRHRLRTAQGAQAYRQRGATVEPVIGHLKDLTGLRRFSMRGLDAARGELDLAAAVTNLVKLHRARTA